MSDLDHEWNKIVNAYSDKLRDLEDAARALCEAERRLVDAKETVERLRCKLSVTRGDVEQAISVYGEACRERAKSGPEIPTDRHVWVESSGGWECLNCNEEAAEPVAGACGKPVAPAQAAGDQQQDLPF